MKNMNLIINTHWDREYRWSFSETQYRLVEAVDDLIDIMLKDKGFAYFHTDSQVSMLDDYLEVRPERTEEVKKLVSEGRILTGPWYTLPAEYLVNGEALVRNLLLGHKISKELGKTMKAAYNIFSWGQVSQLPQIYRQFGMDAIIFYRGVNQAELDTLEFVWKGADDKATLALTFGSYHRLNFWHYVYLPYIMGKNKGVTRDELGKAFLTQMSGASLVEMNQWLSNQGIERDFESARQGLEELIETVLHKSSTDELLFLQGFDQENPDPVVTELVDRLNETISDGRIEIASLEQYIEKVKQKLPEEKRKELPVLQGEMLSVEHTGDAFGPLYNGVFSARMPVKLKNTEAENCLINGAEPVAAWRKLLGGEYPGRMLDRAWKEILKNQQHDGIGGCHVDRVTNAMMERYQIAEDIAQTIIKKTLKAVTSRIDYSFLEEKQIGLTVYNTLPFERKGIVACMVDIPVSWGLRCFGKGKREISILAQTPEGINIPSQLLALEDDTIYAYLKYGNVFSFDASRCLVLLELSRIPASGYLSLTLIPQKGEERPVRFLSPRANTLENENMLVKINPNGSLAITEKATGITVDQVHYFEDTSEKAGPLTHSPAYEQLRMTTLSEPASVALVYNGPLQTTYRVSYRWKLPRGVETKLKIHVPHGSEWIDQGKLERSGDLGELLITTDITLKKGATALEFHTTVDNNIKDHRLRVMFETDRKEAMQCRADSPYDVVKRDITVPDSSGWYEAAARTWPSHSLVAVDDSRLGATVYHMGIPEYEVADDETRTIALTLLRCFSNAGNPTEVYEYQELAQCQGKHQFHYLFEVREAGTPDSELLKRAQANIISCYAMQTTRHEGTLPAKNSFLNVDHEDFFITAMTETEDGNGILIRGFNATDAEIAVNLTSLAEIKAAKKVTLEGAVLEALPVDRNRTVLFTAGKREIVTVCLTW